MTDQTSVQPFNPDLSKPFWASQTIWSAVVGASATGAVLSWKTGDMAGFATAMTAILGGINAIVGRVRATTAIA